MADQYSFKKRAACASCCAPRRASRRSSKPWIRPAEKAKLWYEYRPIFLTERRIHEGTDFWLAHRQELDQGERAARGVAPEYLAAILGVETYYGRLTGTYRVLDALATLAFDYPARAKFFRDELEQFLLLTRDAKLDPLTRQGILRRRDGRAAVHAVELPPLRGRRERATAASTCGRNWPDVCASVGNYLKEHGWNAGEPVLSEADVGTGQSRGSGRP